MQSKENYEGLKSNNYEKREKSHKGYLPNLRYKHFPNRWLIVSKLDQFINKTIKKWKIKLLIRKSIFFTTDKKVWKKLAMVGNDPFVEKVFGANSTSQDLILINVAKHKGSKKKLQDTILHELLHSKHPIWSEKQIRKEVKRLL